MSTQQSFENKAGYNMNFEIGSTHWINTLMSRVSHIGEFIMKNGPPKTHILEDWASDLMNIAYDVKAWREGVAVPNIHLDEIIKEMRKRADLLEQYKEMVTDLCHNPTDNTVK